MPPQPALLILLLLAILVDSTTGQTTGTADSRQENGLENRQELDGKKVKTRFSKSSLHAARKFLLRQDFASHINMLQRICKLDRNQTLKLKVAAKKLTSRLADEWIDKFIERYKGIFGSPDRNKKEIVVEDVDQFDTRTLQFATNSIGSPIGRSYKPRQLREWEDILKNVLTGDQFSTYRKHTLQADTRYRKTLVDFVMTTLVRDLNLTDEQAGKIRKQLTPQIEKMNAPSSAIYTPYVLFGQLTKIDQNQIKQILPHSQFQQWKLFVHPYRATNEMLEKEKAAAQKEKDNAERP